MIALKTGHRALAIQFFKFGIVGFIGFLVDYGILKFGMVVLGFNFYIARLFSFLIAASVTWICNRLFTFRGQSRGSIHTQWMKFLVVCGGGFILNYGTSVILTADVGLVKEYPILAVAAGSIAGMFFNFFAARRLVFR